MHKLLAIFLILPSLGFSSNTILDTSSLNLGEVLNQSYFFQEANKDQSYSLYIPSSYDSSKTYVEELFWIEEKKVPQISLILENFPL